MSRYYLSGQLGTAQLGRAWLGGIYQLASVSGTFTGQGVFTGAVTPAFFVEFIGQGVFYQPIGGFFTGQGVFYQIPSTCPRDAILLEYFWPRASPAFTMPIAYVTAVNVPNDVPQCSPSTNTIPVTGSFSTLVEGLTQPQNNP